MNCLSRVLCSLAMLTAVAVGQQSGAPASAPMAPVSPAPQAEQNNPSGDKITPDHKPVSGAELLTLGSFESGQNVLVPSLYFSETLDTKSPLSTGRLGLQGMSSFGGSMALNRTTQSQAFTLKYAGGSVLYSDTSNLNTSFHQVGVSEKFIIRRWTVLMSDDYSYLPESPLNGSIGAFGSFGDIGMLAYIFRDLQPTFFPSQGIYTLRETRWSNTAVGQIGYNLSPRTMWTASGSYGMLRFSHFGFYESNQVMFRSGISHELTAKDTIGVTYDGGILTYLNLNGEIRTHAVQLSYARRLTGRISLQMSGGPQIYTMDGIGTSNTRVTGTGGLQLQYQRGRNVVSASFGTGVTPGAGVFAGGRASSFTAGVTRDWTPNWSTYVAGGFSRTEALAGANAYNSGFGSAQVSRRLGRYVSVFVSYTGQRQSGGGGCVTSGCSGDFLRHMFGFGLNWTFRPIRLGHQS